MARRGIGVTLIETSPGLVERIRLHQVAAGEEVPLIPYSRIFRGLPVEVIRARVTSIDRAGKVVATTAGDVVYDRLIYALGSRIEPGLPNALTVERPATVVQRLQKAHSVLVIGGGLTGIETASEIVERFPRLDVTMADRGRIGASLSDGARNHLHEWLTTRNVTLLENTEVSEASADVVLWCGSFTTSPIAGDAGLAVNGRGQILVDENLRSSDPSIFAIGDAAAFRDLRMACATALPMAGYVADYLSGTTQRPFRFAYALICISLGRNDGIVQFVNADDSPRETFLSGRPAAWVKELICRYVVASIRLERIGVPFQWLKKQAA
jgi:NADH dehydrogenase FAD-containing subunit